MFVRQRPGSLRRYRQVDILSRFFNQAAGRTLRCAMVCSHQTFDEFGAWHPRWHSVVMEGVFGHHDPFFFIPLGATDASEIWRRSVSPYSSRRDC